MVAQEKEADDLGRVTNRPASAADRLPATLEIRQIISGERVNRNHALR